MVSLRARIVELALPLLGLKRFFSEPERIDARIAKARAAATPRPRKKWHKRFQIMQDTSRGFPLVTLTPRGGARADAPHMLYLHGGAYVLDIASLHWDAIAMMCERLGASASVPLYPLAPEASVETTLPAMRALFDELAAREGASSIALAGDSAGGGMALALAQDLAASDAAMPGSLLLFSPWLDGASSDPRMTAIDPLDRMLAPQGLAACATRYAGGLPIEDPRISPLLGPLTGLPPLAIFAGTRDILLIDARRLRDRLEELGEPAALYVEAERMQHVWMLLPIPEGRAALEQAAAFLQDCHAS